MQNLTISEPGLRPAIYFIKEQTYINGQWSSAASGKTYQIRNPSNGNILGKVPDMDDQDTKQAIAAAIDAFQKWKFTTAMERSVLLKKWHALIVENVEALARLLTAEMGKPLAEARSEIVSGAGYVEWFAEEAKRAYGDHIPSSNPTKRIVVIKQPVGVVGMITPCNYPSCMITRKAAPALAAGCTVVLKPAEETPFSALALATLAEEAGIPAGVFNIITCSKGNAAKVGKVLCADPLVSKISFTGSTLVGKILLKQAAETVKGVSMQLGSNTPFVVFDSADVDKAVKGAMLTKFRNSGQKCVSSDRFLVQEGIYDKFVEGLSEAMESLQVGDGFAKGTNMGPLINSAALEEVESMVSDAIAHGAEVIKGGKRHELGGTFFEPTLLTRVNINMKCWNNEIFGPVGLIVKFKTEEEAVAIMNDSCFGLAGYFYSNDISQCWRIAENMETGMVGINEGHITMLEAPFGGVKESGLGREGSKYGMDEYLEPKYICFGGI